MLGFTPWVSLLLVAGICLALAKQFPCYAENGENATPYMLTGTKTGYLVVMNTDEARVEDEGCEPPHSAGSWPDMGQGTPQLLLWAQ